MDEWVGSFLGIFFGVLLIVLALPMMRGGIARQSWFGYRSILVMHDDEHWYPVNMRAGKHLVTIGTILLTIGLIGLYWRDDDDVQQAIAWIVLAVLIIGGILSTLFCTKLGRNLPASE